MRRITRVYRTGLVLLALAGVTYLLRVSPPLAGANGETPLPVAADDAPKPFGLDGRVPWKTSRLAGTPEPPPPYRAEVAFPKLKFEQPLVLTTAKGIDRLFVAEVKGKVYTFPNDPAADRPDLVFDLGKAWPEFTNLYGMTFHPNFPQKPYVYICYVLRDGLPDGTRVSRFEVSRTDPPHIDPAGEKILISYLSGGHNAGCLEFGNDGYLYIATGDAAGPSPPDTLDTGQDVSDLLSSILRIDVDHEDEGNPYRVPADNPFVNMPGVRPEIWAFGFRNPWRMSFDRPTGELWVGDVGWELWEMVYRVERGGNYGWSVMEGRQPVHPEGRRGPGPILPPTFEHPHSEAASITGGYVYHGSKLPDLAGVYVYGDFQSGKVWGLRVEGKQVVWQRELANTPLQLVAFGQDHAGEIYALDYERTKQIYRFAPNPEAARTNRDFPRLLSQTGLFSSTATHTPAPGVIPYSVNAELWSDHATGDRLLAVPEAGRIKIDRRGNWTFPEGSVLAKTISVEIEQGKPATRRRMDTQVLHFEEGSWRPYTYMWNDEQTDAALVDAPGGSRTITVRDPHAPGGERVQQYRFHSRAECSLCHNPWVEQKTTVFGRQSASPLAMYTMQLNRDQQYGPGAVVDNQLRVYQHIGLLADSLPASTESLPRLANPYDETADLELRSRAYFHVNCSYCHQFNAGGTASILLSYDVPLARTLTVGVRPMQGAFGISAARIIAPGDPDGSVLYYRVSKLGGGRMPRLGSTMVDERAIKLVHDWILSLSKGDGGPAPGEAAGRLSAGEAAALDALRAGPRTPPEARAQAIRLLSDSTRSALALMRLVDQGTLAEPVRREVIAATKDNSRVEVRDLFERFVPDKDRVKRLGDVVNTQDILNLKGDADRGRKFFFEESAAQCKTCHRIQGVGETLGPDLSQIGTKYTKAALLQEILEPSRTVDPKYVSFLLETKAGQVHSGLLAEKTDTEVVLRDAQNKPIRVPAGDVEQLVPQSKSLMPELLVRDLTAQQVADLLEFLSSQRAADPEKK